MRVLIIGCGYVGVPLGAELVRRGHQVHGMRRSPDHGDLLSAGIRPLVGDVTRPGSLRLAGFDWIINTVSSSKGGSERYRAVYLEGTENVLRALSTSPPARYLFTSSTSVFGQTDGSRVTEQSPTEPASSTGRILVQTERRLLEAHARHGFPAIIVRLAGIYGPGRGHLFHQFLRGEAHILGKGERYLNMVHLDDVVGGILAALEKGRPGEVYNLADDEPPTEMAFFEWLAAHLDRPLPPAVAEADAPPRKRGMTNKRVANVRLKTELGYSFHYPTFREGYEAEICRIRPASEKEQRGHC